LFLFYIRPLINYLRVILKRFICFEKLDYQKKTKVYFETLEFGENLYFKNCQKNILSSCLEFLFVLTKKLKMLIVLGRKNNKNFNNFWQWTKEKNQKIFLFGPLLRVWGEKLNFIPKKQRENLKN